MIVNLLYLYTYVQMSREKEKAVAVGKQTERGMKDLEKVYVFRTPTVHCEWSSCLIRCKVPVEVQGAVRGGRRRLREPVISLSAPPLLV